jgi:hypothetical protein
MSSTIACPYVLMRKSLQLLTEKKKRIRFKRRWFSFILRVTQKWKATELQPFSETSLEDTGEVKFSNRQTISGARD